MSRDSAKAHYTKQPGDPDEGFITASDAQAAIDDIYDDMSAPAVIADGSVTSGKIAADAVGSAQIATGAVGSGELATDAVTSDKIADGAVSDGHVAADAAIARTKIDGLWDIDEIPSLSPDIQGRAVSLSSGWSVNGATVSSGSVSDTDSPGGSTSISMTTLTNGTMAKAARYGAPALDTTSGQFAMLVKVSDVSKLQSIQLYAGGGGFAWYTLLNAAFGGTPPYTTVRSNEWCWITFGRRGQDTSGSVAMPNTTDWQIAVTPVNGQQVTVKVAAIRVLSRVAAFPNGVISLVFDDGLDSVWTHARPVLQERGVAATAAVIADVIGESSFMTEAQLESLYSLGRWEISGHQYTSDRDDITALTDSELRAEFVALKTWLRSKGWSRGIDMYVYPQGRHDARTARIVREFFKFGRVTYSSPGGLPRVADPTNGQAYVVDASTTVGDLQTDVDAAKANGEWRIYVFHSIVTSGATGGDVTQGTLAALIDYAIAAGVPILPMGEALS